MTPALVMLTTRTRVIFRYWKEKCSPQKIHVNVFLMNYCSWLMAEELQALSHFNKVSSTPCLLEPKGKKVRIVKLIDKAL